MIDWSSPEFLGVRSADAFLRVYGRDAWGWPVGVALHHFGGGVDAAAEGEALRALVGSGPGRGEERLMPQYAVMIFERETPGGVADIPEDVMAAHMARCPSASGRPAAAIIAGLALEQTGTATTIRGGLVTDGPFIESKEALAGVFVLEARDLDHALALAGMTPIMDGGVEVRPLIGFSPDGT